MASSAISGSSSKKSCDIGDPKQNKGHHCQWSLNVNVLPLVNCRLELNGPIARWLLNTWNVADTKVRCTVGIHYTPDFKDLTPKKVKCLICNFIIYEMIIFLNIELFYINTHNVLL